jgi:hypothetical protein
MTSSHPYYQHLAAAFVRGCALSGDAVSLPETLLHVPLDSLTCEQLESVIAIGAESGLRLHKFKRTHETLPRVRRVLGILQGIALESLLDVGSGRGAFLWPCLNAFPRLPVTVCEVASVRIPLYEAVQKGGIDRLCFHQSDIVAMNLPDRSFGVVTMLEVLEHLERPLEAIQAGLRLASRHFVVSVPSKEDNNPTHIHFLNKPKLEALFKDAGCQRIRFDGVPGHLILIASPP